MPTNAIMRFDSARISWFGLRCHNSVDSIGICRFLLMSYGIVTQNIRTINGTILNYLWLNAMTVFFKSPVLRCTTTVSALKQCSIYEQSHTKQLSTNRSLFGCGVLKSWIIQRLCAQIGSYFPYFFSTKRSKTTQAQRRKKRRKSNRKKKPNRMEN